MNKNLGDIDLKTILVAGGGTDAKVVSKESKVPVSIVYGDG